jgi:hypothetical protein
MCFLVLAEAQRTTLVDRACSRSPHLMISSFKKGPLRVIADGTGEKMAKAASEILEPCYLKR